MNWKNLFVFAIVGIVMIGATFTISTASGGVNKSMPGCIGNDASCKTTCDSMQACKVVACDADACAPCECCESCESCESCEDCEDCECCEDCEDGCCVVVCCDGESPPACCGDDDPDA